MKSGQDWYFVICFLLVFWTSLITSQQQICSPPDVSVNGGYTTKDKLFQAGASVTYNCQKGYTLMGKETSKCKSTGDWSNPPPFCDLKATLTNAHFHGNNAERPCPSVKDDNIDTCFQFYKHVGTSIRITLDKKGIVFAVRMLLGTGASKMQITAGTQVCKSIRDKFIETSQWVLLECNKMQNATKSIKIENTLGTASNSTICEIEVYAKDEDDCDEPPERSVSNGYFKFSRSTAELFCEDGYKSDKTRLVCEDNKWRGTVKPLCNEILCGPAINVTLAPDSKWEFLDTVSKISVNTRRQLKCGKGYKIDGSPDIVVCQKNGTWTRTNAICKKVEEKNTKSIIIGTVAVVVILLILVLLGITIYFVRKQRSREVVVIYKQSTEGSVVSGSEGDYAVPYYETVRSNEPVSPTDTRPTDQTQNSRYYLPQNKKDTLKRQPMPADIAFGTLKQSALYG